MSRSLRASLRTFPLSAAVVTPSARPAGRPDFPSPSPSRALSGSDSADAPSPCPRMARRKRAHKARNRYSPRAASRPAGRNCCKARRERRRKWKDLPRRQQKIAFLCIGLTHNAFNFSARAMYCRMRWFSDGWFCFLTALRPEWPSWRIFREVAADPIRRHVEWLENFHATSFPRPRPRPSEKRRDGRFSTGSEAAARDSPRAARTDESGSGANGLSNCRFGLTQTRLMQRRGRLRLAQRIQQRQRPVPIRHQLRRARHRDS